MKGFFNIASPIHQPAGKKGRALSCADCSLSAKCKSPRMEPTGEGRKGIYHLAEVPGKTEDEQGKQLIGEAGQLYRKKLAKFGIDLDRDCWKHNAVNCRTFVQYKDCSGNLREHNRTPTTTEINCCRPRVLRAIQERQPEKIFLLGASALTSFLGHRMNKLGGINKWIGWAIPDQLIGAWVFPMYHPSYLLRSPDNRALDRLLDRQLQRAIEWDKPFPHYGSESDKVLICTELEEAKDHLRAIIGCIKDGAVDKITFDYETTGLKPHAAGHKIICMSLSVSGDGAVAFPMFDDVEFLEMLRWILTNPKVKKIGANIKFEDTWSHFILGYKVEGWWWDVILAEHAIDNRPGITGVKSQTYRHYGLIGYEDEVARYLKSPPKAGDNAFNSLEAYFKRNPKIVLTYCGMDSMMTFRRAEDQLADMKLNCHELINPYRQLFLQGALAFSDIEADGICVDVPYYEKQKTHLERQIEKIHKRILQTDEAKRWQEVKGKTFSPSSDDQIGKLLYEILGHKPTKETAKGEGKGSVDKEALSAINTTFVKLIMQFRKLTGLRDKIDAVLRETVNGVLRPNTNLNTVATNRSSSTSPNFHNFDKKDLWAQQIVRSGIKPRPGHMLLRVDYKGIEVVIGGCNSLDPELLRYLRDPTTNMHTDEALHLFMLEKEQLTDALRDLVKSNFVFAEMYGSYWVQCAPNLWFGIEGMKLADGTLVKDHLRNNGVRSLPQFEAHVKKEEEWFWGVKFKKYDEWRRGNCESYERFGYIKQLTGFVCRWGKSGLLGRNDIYDYPNQGPAFHCTLWSIIKLNKELKSWDARILGQIHDELLFDVSPDELPELKRVVRRVMCEDIRREWQWLVVPLEISAKVSEVDGNWFEMRKTEI